MALEVQQPSYVSDGHVVLTGPIKGAVVTADGTTYDVSAPVIEVAEEHKDEVAHLIGERYAAEGHPDHDDETPFVHETAAPAEPVEESK